MKLFWGNNEQRKDATLKNLFILVTTLFSCISQASVYSCKVIDEYLLSDAGKIVVKPDYSGYRNIQFNVDKTTGVISSDKMIITNELADKRTVIDMGSRARSRTFFEQLA